MKELNVLANPCENFYEISPRSRRDLGENRGEIAARSRRVFGRRDFPISPRSRPRSRRDHGEIREISAAKNSPRSRRDSRRDAGNLGGQKRAAISPRFSPRCGKSRRPKTRRDLAAILAEMREISAAKNAPRSRRDSRRDAGNLGGQKRAAISPRFSPRCGKSRRPKTRRDLAEIAARYGNLGRQIRGEMLQRDRGEIRKSRRPKRAVIAR